MSYDPILSHLPVKLRDSDDVQTNQASRSTDLQAALHAAQAIAFGLAIGEALEALRADEAVPLAAAGRPAGAAIGRALALPQTGLSILLLPLILPTHPTHCYAIDAVTWKLC